MKVIIRLLGHTKPLYEADRDRPVVHIQVPHKLATVEHTGGGLTIILDSTARTLSDDATLKVEELSRNGSLVVRDGGIQPPAIQPIRKSPGSGSI